MLETITLNNIKYDIFYSQIKTKSKIKIHKNLVRALWDELTEERKKKLIIINPYNIKLLYS